MNKIYTKEVFDGIKIKITMEAKEEPIEEETLSETLSRGLEEGFDVELRLENEELTITKDNFSLIKAFLEGEKEEPKKTMTLREAITKKKSFRLGNRIHKAETNDYFKGAYWIDEDDEFGESKEEEVNLQEIINNLDTQVETIGEE